MDGVCTVCCTWTGGLFDAAQLRVPSIKTDVGLPILFSLYRVSCNNAIISNTRTPGYGPVQPAEGDPALAGGLD